MSPSAVLAFWVVAAVLIVVPGPDWAFAISAGLRRHVVPATGGIVLGYGVLTICVAAGLGLLVASTPAALTALTLVGGGYLVWLGTKTIRQRPSLAAAEHAPPGARWATVLQGMAVSGLNPKGLLIFVALLPQFADPRADWPMPAQLAALGVAFTTTCGVVYLAVGATASRLLRARPGPALVVSRVSGASLIVLGLALLVEHLAG